MTVASGDGLVFSHLPGRRSADPLPRTDTASSVRLVEMEHTGGRTAHRHPRSEEIVYVASGTGRIWIDGTGHPIGTGDIVHIPAGAAHATIPDPGTTMRLVCFFPHPDLGSNLEETDLAVS